MNDDHPVLCALHRARFLLVILGSVLVATPCGAQEKTQEEKLQDLQKKQDELQKTIDEMREEIDAFKQVVPETPKGTRARVKRRDAMEDRQTSAARLNDLTLDPEYRGFLPVPNTGVMIRFNAHPRVDVTSTNNKADPDRFVTYEIPVPGEPGYDTRTNTNINSKASALTFEAVAPGVEGNPRFFYKNDFFGSGSNEFEFRVQHLYGEYYNFIVGQTFSVFEDPDIWPDTVDFEGPNSMIFARHPLLQYLCGLGDDWTLKVSVEQPDSQIDSFFGVPVQGFQSLPDAGLNVRWEDAEIGHTQLASIFRYIGADSPIRDQVFGWGLNLSSAVHLTEHDTLMGQVTYGEGIGRYGNDTSFGLLDAAFDANGNLQALPYLGVFAGITHDWSDQWRSTATYGFVNVGNEVSQPLDAYDQTQYMTCNVIYQLRERLAIGVEVQYGTNQVRSGADAGLLGLQLGVRYNLF